MLCGKLDQLTIASLICDEMCVNFSLSLEVTLSRDNLELR